MTVSLVAFATVLLVSANVVLAKISWVAHENDFINGILKYQIYTLLIALIVALITLIISPESRALLTFGAMGNVAIKEKWLGINGISTWKSNGLQLLFFISCATALFMFLGVKYTNSLGNLISQTLFVFLVLAFYRLFKSVKIMGSFTNT